MASIVSSVIVSDVVQVDGRHAVVEQHTDSLGFVHLFQYLAELGIDINAALSAHATQVLNSLVNGEIATNIAMVEAQGSLAVPVFVYTTMAQNATPLREAYRVSTQGQAIQIGDYLNTLTDAQLAAGFGITQAQAANLRANKLQPAAQTAATVRAETGV
jgi:hypothetical protein